MVETCRHFEKIAKRALAFLNRNEQSITLKGKCDILKTAHSADILAADVATTLGMGGSGLEEIVNEMDRLLHNKEIVDIYQNELWPKWFETHKTINGYESFALRAEAGRIAAERRKNIQLESPII